MLFSPQLIVPPQRRIVVAAVAGTTWNPADLTGGVVSLSNSNRTAANLGATGGVRSVASVSSSEKAYWEVVDDVETNADNEIGIANASWTLTSRLQGTVNSGGITGNDGAFLINFSPGKTGNSTFTSGGVTGWALDGPNARLWTRVGSGNWNNDVAANPATNTNGIDISSIIGPWFVAFYSTHFSCQATGNFATADWANAAPSGFTQVV